MTGPVADTLVAPLLRALRDCLCAQLQTSPLGGTCRCMIVHSSALPVMDGCDCSCDGGTQGDAWVRLVRLDPDTALFATIASVCPPGWQAVIELGTYRCVPIPEEGVEILPESQVDATTMNLLGDMHALLRTVACCPVLRDLSVGVEFYSPIGAEGGCAGGILQLRVALSGGPPGGCL